MTPSEIAPSGKTKIAHYDWGLKDQPGVLIELAKTDLLVDPTYQREARNAKVIAIARQWSWIACGVIIVAERDGSYYVIDGQHRVAAACRRSDITTLPCLVFESTNPKQEAAGFISIHTQRKPITSVDRYRALLCTEDEASIFVNQLITTAGRVASETTGPHNARCLTLLLQLAKTQRQKLEHIWPLITALCHGQPLHEQIVHTLAYIEERMPDNQSLMDDRWRKRLLQIGYTNLRQATMRAAAFYSRGGVKVWAKGAVEQINHGLRHRLTLPDDV